MSDTPQQIMILNDWETYSDSDGCMIATVIYDGNVEGNSRTEFDKLCIENAAKPNHWHDVESMIIAQIERVL